MRGTPIAAASQQAANRLLSDCPPGTRARVVGISTDCDDQIARRLADLGFTTNALVQVLRRAPLRDPVEYRIKDYDLCLRRRQAAFVEVTATDVDHIRAASRAGST